MASGRKRRVFYLNYLIFLLLATFRFSINLKWFAIWLHQFAWKMTAAASYILALGFIFLPSVSSVNKGRTTTFQEIAYGSAVDYSIVKTSYPFMVRIFMDGSFRCGGALISDRWVNSDRLVNPYILARIIHILYLYIH